MLNVSMKLSLHADSALYFVCGSLTRSVHALWKGNLPCGGTLDVS